MKSLNLLAFIILIVAFVVLGLGMEAQYIGPGLSFLAMIAFLVLLILAGYLFIQAYELKQMQKFEDKNSLVFIITYKSPLLKHNKEFRTSNQIRLRKVLEKLTKKNIDYGIEIKTPESKSEFPGINY